ncbi:SMI1/KNR4 family protein [Rhodopirellula bahusiensis]|uniref:SMI1/KNR4 family protein n=1 Tax=Rhodopirellula bahusiensis TaxID=2014065 RepID=UPI0032630535
MADNFDAFLKRLESDEIATSSDLRGCTKTEIAALESKYAISLPSSYRRFLELMGHGSRSLFRYDHFATSYEYVIDMTAEQRADFAEDGELQKLDALIGPLDLLILGRLGEQYYFIRCDNPDDSAVYYFNNSDMATRRVYDSVLDYLNAIADECCDAIQGGYFDNSEGTCP